MTPPTSSKPVARAWPPQSARSAVAMASERAARAIRTRPRNSARLDSTTIVSKQIPFRCTFTVTAVALDTDPDPDDAVNDENNAASVPLEVVDQNDL